MWGTRVGFEGGADGVGRKRRVKVAARQYKLTVEETGGGRKVGMSGPPGEQLAEDISAMAQALVQQLRVVSAQGSGRVLLPPGGMRVEGRNGT